MNETHLLHKEKINQVQQYLKELGIDCYLIKTKEGSDPSMPLLFGLSIVGDAILIITQQETIGITSSIDAQDVQESNLFDRVITYTHNEFEQNCMK